MDFLSGIASDLGDTLSGAVHTAGQAGKAWVQEKLGQGSSATATSSNTQQGAETIQPSPSPLPNTGQAAVVAQQAATNPFVKYRGEFLAVAGLLTVLLIVKQRL